jgi:phage repressor protein C with HTH and peptisase S24 domain
MSGKAKTAGPAAQALKELRFRATPRVSVRKLADILDMKHTSYQYYEDSYKEPFLPVTFARKVAKALRPYGVEPYRVMELAGTTGDSDDEGAGVEPAESGGAMAKIDEVDVRAAAGAGSINDVEPIVAEWMFPKNLVRSATNAPTERIRILTVVGDSMPETFQPFEKVMVDTTDLTPTPPGVFVVWDGLGLVVKRVEHVAFSEPPTVRIMSDNPKYAPYERVLDEAHIQGRVLGKWQWV